MLIVRELQVVVAGDEVRCRATMENKFPAACCLLSAETEPGSRVKIASVGYGSRS